MRASNVGFSLLAMLCPASLGACASVHDSSFVNPVGGGAGQGTTGGADAGALGTGVPSSDGGGGALITFFDAQAGASAEAGAPGSITQAMGTVQEPDCAGCSFPPLSAPACAGAPAIDVVYPTDGVLVPPNMGLLSIQWKPNTTAGSPYKQFEVDFENAPSTDWRMITSCGPTVQTTDMQQAKPAPTGGCDLPLQDTSWLYVAGANRGKTVVVTVRGTTDGACATVSTPIKVSFADEDLLGTYYYWKSTVSSTGTGGQIWSKLFGAPAASETDVTSTVTAGGTTLQTTCNGCHALSRDGSRMVVYSDDNDSDDEYSDIGGALLDMTQTPAAQLGVGVGGARGGGQPPGFSTIDPSASFYLSSNGLPLTGTGRTGRVTTSAGYTTAVPSNALSLWDGTGTLVGPVPLGDATVRPTMPDWSIDGKTVVYVQPQAVAQWDTTGSNAFAGARQDDDHVFGGSLYTVAYTGNGTFGAPTVFLQSNGENNYYPSYSPDATSTAPPSFVIFDRVALDMSAGSLTGCTTGTGAVCPNDSFSNPAARLFLVGAAASGGTPIDLEKANGSPAANPIPWSNSYPRWAPFVQSYHGNKILWFTFSSTRDYGLRVLNHQSGMIQCYPPDAYETPGGTHGGSFSPLCQEPQLWMAPVVFSEGATNGDPSLPAFWIPYQDPTTHNHTAQWTEQAGAPPPPATCTCSMVGGACGAANPCGCCSPTTTPQGPAGLVCSGANTCLAPAM